MSCESGTRAMIFQPRIVNIYVSGTRLCGSSTKDKPLCEPVGASLCHNWIWGEFPILSGLTGLPILPVNEVGGAPPKSVVIERAGFGRG